VPHTAHPAANWLTGSLHFGHLLIERGTALKIRPVELFGQPLDVCQRERGAAGAAPAEHAGAPSASGGSA
jgi:hypothetical protein